MWISPKRETAFNSIKEQITQENSQSVSIHTFCPTRWTVYGNSIGSILDIKGRIIGGKTLMLKFNVWFGLKLSERISKITDNFSMTLQKQTLSTSQGYDIGQLTVTTYEDH